MTITATTASACPSDGKRRGPLADHKSARRRSCTSDEFREAMRNHAGAVTLLTTAFDGTLHGMTATAVTSVSAEPPTLLVCVNRSASMHDALLRSRRFCVSVLTADQVALSAAFSTERMRELRFRHGGWLRDADGVPFLPLAHARLFCEIESQSQHDTHTVIFGKVTRAETAEGDPLLYHDGGYHRLAPLHRAPVDFLAEHALL
jgi:flavin reductase (DIM6/NTAB) family NADH-FMN oxidoreductase RutF